MMKYSQKIISINEVIPAISEAITNGHQVKFTVSGNSMRPWIVDNRDQVLLISVAGMKLKTGDIILFRTKHGKYILHRIYKEEKNGYRTIGDACLWEDGFVAAADIIGKVIKIYRKGREIDCSSLPWRFIFWSWRKLLPIRKHLLNLYLRIARLKGKMTKRWI